MISIVINYCTTDERFIRLCLNQALQVSDDVIVPVSDHLYDGSPEDVSSINKLASEYPTVKFQLYEWTNEHFPRYWHNMSRIVGTTLADDSSEWVLFLDSDEIVIPQLFNAFLQQDLSHYDSFKFLCHWYFREPIYRAKLPEATQVMVRKSLIRINPYDKWNEREQLFELLPTNRKLGSVSFENKPMFHHFSWVRTEQQMLKKVSSWGHAHDKDWISLIKEEFSRPFNGKDFVHGYDYDVVNNDYNL